MMPFFSCYDESMVQVGTSALLIAARNDHDQLVSVLLERGADYKLRDKVTCWLAMIRRYENDCRTGRQCNSKRSEAWTCCSVADSGVVCGGDHVHSY